MFGPRRTKPCWLSYMVLAACSCFSTCPAQGQTQLQMKLDDVNLDNGHIHFRPSSCDVEPAPSIQNLQQMPQGETTTYLVFADVEKTSLLYSTFIYPFYVERKGATPPVQMCEFRVQATPSGAFADQMYELGFQVGDHTQELESGTINVPLHNNAYKQPILQAEAPSPFAIVSLNGRYPVAVKIVNLLPALPVLLSGVNATPDNPSFWQESPTAVLHFSGGATVLQPAESLDTGIELNLTPNRWHALGASIFPIAPNKAQETIHLSVNFNTPGGIPGALELPVPVRFKPSFWNLSLAVLLGAAIGSGMGLLLPQKNSTKSIEKYKAVLIALGFGIVAEALGMILVNGNSEFRILGFELDPYQLLPATLIGVLVGLMGFRSAGDFLGLFKQDS